MSDDNNTQFIDRARMRSLAYEAIDRERVNEALNVCLVKIRDSARSGRLETDLTVSGDLNEMEKEQVRKKLVKRGFTVEASDYDNEEWRVTW